MAKLVLEDVTNLLGNPSSAANTINDNSARIRLAIENTLSRDGSSPNQMQADLDLNNYDLLNVGLLDADDLRIAGTDQQGFLEVVADAVEQIDLLVDEVDDTVASALITINTASGIAETHAINAEASATEAEMYALMVGAAVYDFNFDSDPTPNNDWNI